MLLYQIILFPSTKQIKILLKHIITRLYQFFFTVFGLLFHIISQSRKNYITISKITIISLVSILLGVDQDLHQELIKTNCGPQTNAALQNFKTLLKLEISLLMGCYIEWGGESEVAAPAAAAGTVLGL
jgi:enamine deaminase RidA (YjgF/YER057c/UK114 family)